MDDGGKGKPLIRQSDRTSEAYIHYATSRDKYNKQKPCGRCKTKNLLCQTAAKQGSNYSISDSQSSEVSVRSSGVMKTSALVADAPAAIPAPADDGIDMQTGIAPTPYPTDLASQPLTTDDEFFFNSNHNFWEDEKFSSWVDFDSHATPQVAIAGPNPQLSVVSTPKTLPHNPSRGCSAFKRSPWLWEPKREDSLGNELEGLSFNEKSIAHFPTYPRILAAQPPRWKMDSAIRDKLFALVLSQHQRISKIPSFPDSELLNYLLQTQLIQDEYQIDSWIHSVSFDPSSAIPELLGALVSSGATFTADPAVWCFGLALQEVVRTGISATFESNNSMTRDLQCLQALILELDTGLWSGFKRKVEMAESFLLTPLTMLRRAGIFSDSSNSPTPIPLASDSPQELETKWRSFITRESYKRLLLHIFFRDVQASIMLQHGTLLSYTELCFGLPASRDLWRASTAKAWREIYLRKKPLPPGVTLPRVADIMHSITRLDLFERFIDVELCYGAILYGFWGQIHAYREAAKFYDLRSTASIRCASRITKRLCLASRHQELYRDVSEYAMLIGSLPKPATQLLVVAELFMMMLHVSSDELQRFAGKQGEDEARQAASHLEDDWIGSHDARHAIWHAGQVIRHARTLRPASLRAFNAIAVYYASLTLWIYGSLSYFHSAATKNTVETPAPRKYVLVDGDESREIRAFLLLDKGTPGISMNGDIHSGIESLSNTEMVLDIARKVFRDNFPVRTEPLPYLVESLGNLLRDLGAGVAGSASEVQSRVISKNRDGSF